MPGPCLLRLPCTSWHAQVLGVERTATPKEIKRAYRAKALELHPDKLGGNVTEEDEQRFIDVVTAYETLSDPDKRRNYDTYGPEVRERGVRAAALRGVCAGLDVRAFPVYTCVASLHDRRRAPRPSSPSRTTRTRSTCMCRCRVAPSSSTGSRPASPVRPP